MGSPITFSGFNNVDFNMILNSIMEQERAPVRTLESQKSALQTQSNAFAQLATKIATLETAAQKLADANGLGGRTATNTDATAVAVTTSNASNIGTYDVIVDELARAQVTPSSTAAPDKDTSPVVNAGAVTIGGKVVTVSSASTLQQFADTINNTTDIGVTASIVQTTGGFKLVLTGKNTGAANAFAITDNTTGIAFDPPTVPASDAAARVNGIPVSSSTNVIEGAIPGASLTLLKKDATKTVTVTVARDLAATEGLVDAFVTAYNDIVQFADDQAKNARNGTAGAIGRDGLLRGLRTRMRDLINVEYGVGGSLSRLAEVGVEFTSTGKLQFDKNKFREKATASLADVEKLFLGSGSVQGAFSAVVDAVDDYTGAGGLVAAARDRITDQIESMNGRLDALEKRLEVRRLALQKEFIAADLAMSRLQQQSQSISSLGGF